MIDFKVFLEVGVVGFFDDGILFESSKVVKEVMEEVKKFNIFISFYEEDLGLNGVFGFNENIVKEYFYICGVIGVVEYVMMVCDVMIVYVIKVYVYI